MTSKYQQLKEAGQIGRGRNKKKMTKEQMRDNLERAKFANSQRQEARRRALIILQNTISSKLKALAIDYLISKQEVDDDVNLN